jgi:hypothetical protein
MPAQTSCCWLCAHFNLKRKLFLSTISAFRTMEHIQHIRMLKLLINFVNGITNYLEFSRSKINLSVHSVKLIITYLVHGMKTGTNIMHCLKRQFFSFLKTCFPVFLHFFFFASRSKHITHWPISDFWQVCQYTYELKIGTRNISEIFKEI